MKAIAVHKRTGRIQRILSKSEWDKHYYTLTSISLSLRNASPVQVPLHLYQAQMRVNKLWEINFSLIEKKSGWIRGRVNGGEFNYSSEILIPLEVIS